MKSQEFREWLNASKMQPNTISARTANCVRVEMYEGDLDQHYLKDKCSGLIEKLTMSKKDVKNAAFELKHNIPIRGDIYTGTSTLREAVKLYILFREGKPYEVKAKAVKSKGSGIKKDWPLWDHPSDDEVLYFTKLTSKYFQYFHPSIIEAITEDNFRNQSEWRDKLSELDIDPDIYLWEGSPCAFPGIRRYAGSKEISSFRGHTKLSSAITGALVLDDNDFPKQLWSFVFQGKKYGKKGPSGYALAHLADHKDHNNRCYSEFDIQVDSKAHALFGLYTCPTNTVYVPNSLLRPTDNSINLRQLLVRKSSELYSSVCNITPPWMKVSETYEKKWDLGNFDWGTPVGTLEHIEDFLKFRRDLINNLIAHTKEKKSSQALLV